MNETIELDKADLPIFLEQKNLSHSQNELRFQ